MPSNKKQNIYFVRAVCCSFIFFWKLP